jgi:hypothetical protein
MDFISIVLFIGFLFVSYQNFAMLKFCHSLNQTIKDKNELIDSILIYTLADIHDKAVKDEDYLQAKQAKDEIDKFNQRKSQLK